MTGERQLAVNALWPLWLYSHVHTRAEALAFTTAGPLPEPLCMSGLQGKLFGTACMHTVRNMAHKLPPVAALIHIATCEQRIYSVSTPAPSLPLAFG